MIDLRTGQSVKATPQASQRAVRREDIEVGADMYMYRRRIYGRRLDAICERRIDYLFGRARRV